MDTTPIRHTPGVTAPTAPSPAAPAPEAPLAAMAGDRFVGRRAAETDEVAALSPWQKAGRGLSLAARALPGAIGDQLSHPGRLLGSFVAPILHPVRSVKEAGAAVAEAGKEGHVEGAIAALKHYGGLLGAWGVPLSIALAPFTGGASLVATAAVAAGTLGLAATGASLAKNVVDASRAGSAAELDEQSRQMTDDGLGLLTAAATAGVGKAAHGALARPRPLAVPESLPAPRPVAGRDVSAPSKSESRRAKRHEPEPPTAPAQDTAEPLKPAPVKEAAPAAETQTPVATAPKAPDAAAIVRKALPATPKAVEQAIADGANFYSPTRVNYMVPLLEEAGYDGLPQLATRAELDSAIAKGATELYRGVSDAAYADQFRQGPLYIGTQNANGSGTWAGIGAEGQAVATRYAPGRGAVLRMALKPEAKVVGFGELTAMLKEEKAQAVLETNAAREQLKAAVDAAPTPEEAARIKQEGQKAIQDKLVANGLAFTDLGRYGVLKGYDAIRADSTGFMNVLNRTALLVQETNAERNFHPVG